MDAFLRRVVAQRDLEQEVAILATPPETLVTHCRMCGRRTPDASTPVCTACGGWKVGKRLAARDALLKLAGIHPTPNRGITMASTENRKCLKCSKKLHWRNTGDSCLGCREPAGDGEVSVRRAKKDGSVLKRFRVVANALGADPEKLISDFAEGWLDQVKRSVQQS